ncbi:sugar phosphate isomerase/epimerase [Candidatus Calescamantes bacterium]|nr:sugar phosphate isomerase/epimerase [Candidatus Calescamantes bacterium]
MDYSFLQLNVSTWNYVCSYNGVADLKKIISEIKKDGFGVELWMNWLPDKSVYDRDNWSNIKNWLSGVKDITIHSECANKDLESIKREIELSSYLGARLLVVHVLNFGVVEAENMLEIDSKYFKKILHLAEKNGVVLALENGYFKLLQEFCNLAGNSENLKICLDIGHANIHKQTLLPENCSDPIGVFIQEFGNRIAHFHIHDNFGKNDDHLPPGRGSINWSMVIKHFKNLNRKIRATLEIRGNISDARAASLQARNFLNNCIKEYERNMIGNPAI